MNLEKEKNQLETAISTGEMEFGELYVFSRILLEPYYLIDEYEKLKKEKPERWEENMRKYPKLKSLLTGLNYDSNPIILKY